MLQNVESTTREGPRRPLSNKKLDREPNTHTLETSLLFKASKRSVPCVPRAHAKKTLCSICGISVLRRHTRAGAAPTMLAQRIRTAARAQDAVRAKRPAAAAVSLLRPTGGRRPRTLIVLAAHDKVGVTEGALVMCSRRIVIVSMCRTRWPIGRRAAAGAQYSLRPRSHEVPQLTGVEGAG